MRYGSTLRTTPQARPVMAVMVSVVALRETHHGSKASGLVVICQNAKVNAVPNWNSSTFE